jgi:cell division protein FtsL
MTAALKQGKRFWVALVFLPLMSLLFLTEYFYPEIVQGYQTRLEQFLDLYLTLLIATFVIFKVLSMIMEAYNAERQRLSDANSELEQKIAELNRVNADLKKMISEVKTLTGLLPICSWCKKIRDDQGYWSQIEKYVKSHSTADFSHSICPECAQKHFPELEIGQAKDRK